MAQFPVLIAGLLRIAVSQAHDVEEADPSTVHGFLSKLMPAAAQHASTSLDVHVPLGLSESEYRAAKPTEWRQMIEKKQTLKDDQFASSGHTFAKAQASDATKSLGDFFDVRKFIVPTFSNVNPGHGPDAISHHHKLAENSPEADGGASSFMIIDDRPILHPAPNMQDLSALASASGKPAIATKEEEKAAQKLLANDNNSLVTLSAIGVGILALMTMLGVRIRRGLRPATVLASSGALGSDMFNEMVPGLGDNIMEMKSHGSCINGVASGEGISDARGSKARADRIPGDLAWDPLDLLTSDPTAGLQPVVFTVDPEEEAERAEENLSPAEMEEYLFTESKKWTPVYGFLILAAILPGLLNPTDPLDRALDLWVGGKP